MTPQWNSFATLLRRESERNFSVWQQTFLPPVISALLYVIVFGRFIGDRIGEVGGGNYIDFLIPGLIMMNLIMGSYGSTAFSVFFSKWERTIQDILTAPLSYLQMVAAILIGAGLIRGLVIAASLMVALAFFGSVTLLHPLVALYYLVAVGVIFSCLGMMVGLWADRFDHFNVIQTFLITPLIYLGGVFYAVDTLPEKFQLVARLNPMLYMVNGLRYGMTGYTDANLMLNAAVVTSLAVVSVVACILLFRSGYKLRT